jgi:ABC-type enterochelin transport system substrate-binding protein
VWESMRWGLVVRVQVGKISCYMARSRFQVLMEPDLAVRAPRALE